MFTFCPLQGALSESAASQSLLELDGGIKVLVGLGWDETFDVAKLSELEKQVPTLSLILLTHATTAHLAAYAHCCKNIPLFTRVPVYATRPVIDLGRTLTQDIYASTPAAATTIPARSLEEIVVKDGAAQSNLLLQAPTTEEVARYFSLIQPLKYSQPHQPLQSPFSPPLNGLTITAYNSGHTLGGTIWHIQHGLESVVYAVDWNQAREHVFAGAAWLGGAGGGGAEVIEQLRKPTALICSSRGADRTATSARAKRDEQLVDMIRACVTKGGTVLIPVDSSARVLEMSYLLEHAWRADKGELRAAKLFLAGRNMSSTMRYASSMLEWMDDGIVQEFEAFAEGQRRANGVNEKKEAGPLDFKYLRLLERKAQIAKLLGTPAEAHGRVILATDTSMDWGFSKDLIKGVADDANNLLILTDRVSVASEDTPSIARTLWAWWREKRDGVAIEQTSGGDNMELVYGGGRDLEVREAKREALEGEELAVYQQWLARQWQLQSTQQTGGAGGLDASADAVDDASSDSSDDSEDEDSEQQGKALTALATMGQASRRNVVLNDEDLGVNVLIKKKGIYDFDVRGKKGRDRSFPITIRRKRADDFGDLIRPEEYLRAEEKEDDALGLNAAVEDTNVGTKRKWDDVAKGASAKRPAFDRAASVDGDAAVDAFAGDELDKAEDGQGDEPTGPCKLAYITTTVAVNMRIGFVDFSGVHDKRSLNMLIPLIQPRKLILVGGTRDETLSLATDCRAALSTADRVVDVFTPEIGTSVDASVDTNAWVVKLADPLVKKLKWQHVRGLRIATITGQLLAKAREDPAALAEALDSANKRQKTEVTSEDKENVPLIPILDVLPTAVGSAARSAARPLHVGDLRLADLRRAMQALGHAAEFRGEGTLVLDGTVTVKKTAEGRVDIESVGFPFLGPGQGARRNTMYEVKRVIYASLAVVGG